MLAEQTAAGGVGSARKAASVLNRGRAIPSSILPRGIEPGSPLMRSRPSLVPVVSLLDFGESICAERLFHP